MYLGPIFANGSRVKLTSHLLIAVPYGAVGKVNGFRMESGVGVFYVEFPQGAFWVASTNLESA